jgi:prepilin-type N-terminal cleavage/methylation domain-containing protein
MLLRRGTLADDRGFTLVEVMVAVVILLVGVLGTVTMVTGANAQTAVTKSREGAINLAREITDAARGMQYDTQLDPTDITPALQSQPGLADSDTNLAGWQIARRGITYTVASLPICIVDARADGFGAHPAATAPAPDYCTGQTTGTDDGNPDDFRRMDVTLAWAVGAKAFSLRDTTLIINPSGGIGPTIKSVCLVNAATDTACAAPQPNPLTATSPPRLNFLALTSPADTTTWTVDDGSPATDVNSSNPSAPTGTAWSFPWNIGTPTEATTPTPVPYSCGMAIDWTLDGNYIVTAQGITGIGSSAVPGQLKPYTMTLNRSKPYKICGLAGGYDSTAWSGHPAGVDLEWRLNPERDIIGYRVIDPSGVVVCDTTNVARYPYSQGSCVCSSQTSCVDTSPSTSTSTVTYQVTALDRDPSGNPRPTDSTAQTTIDVNQDPSFNQPPDLFAPGTVTVGISNGLPVITWPMVGDPNSASGDFVKFFRIYRNGIGYANRYDRVDVQANTTCSPTSVTCSYTDQAPSAGGDTYYVSAADSHYDESQAQPAVAP